MKVFRTLCRILLGLVFVFSGFVKAVDPLGSQYKFTDYFLAFGWDFFIPGALAFGFLLFTVELFLGFAFVFNIRIRQLSWLMLAFMLFFTGLTLWLAVTNKVSDCGCFGDAIVMTNWETFWKNIILMVPTLVVFFTRKKFVNRMNPRVQLSIAVIALAIPVCIGVYGLRHLPLLDFMPWKKGAVISRQVLPTPEKAEIKLVYRNKETGEMLEYTAETLPWKDSVFFAKLEFVDQKKVILQEYIEAPIHDFIIDDRDKNSFNDSIIGNRNWQFIIVSYNLEKASEKGFEAMNAFAQQCASAKVDIACFTGSGWDQIDAFNLRMKTACPWYTVDPTALKSVVRSNPGLILLKDGVVADKWAWRDVPEFAEFQQQQAEYLNLISEAKKDTLASQGTK